MYAKIEPSGCIEQHGNVHIRLAFYLEPTDARYDEHHVNVVDETCPIWQAGYQGKVDKDGQPVNQAAYDTWLATCRHIWRDNPFHNHFINGDPDITDKEIEDLAGFHLANFYEAWKQKKTIRSGWDVAHRIYPIRYEEFDSPEIFALRKTQCEQRVEQIKSLSISVSPLGEGKTFPATAIDVGAGAADRDGLAANSYTLIDYNNAANDTGSLDTFELWFNTTGAGVKVGTFENTAGTNFTNRDVEVIGDVTASSKQTFSGKNCDVTSGDWAGVYYTSGNIERESSGLNGVYYKAGDQFGTGSQSYTSMPGNAISIYATGETAGGNVTVTPGTLSLTITTYAPTVSVSDNQAVTPTTLALVITTYAPTISISDNKKVTPSTLALVITTYAPTVSTPRVVTPTTLALTITTYTPTVTVTADKVVTPGTLALVITTYAPTVSTPRLVTPGTLALVITTYSPNIIIGTVVTPSTLALILTTYAPTIAVTDNKVVTPSTLALILTTYVPSVTIGTIVTPSTLALSLAMFAPDAIIGVTLSVALPYIIEARDSSGDLVAIFENAHAISLVEQLNRPPMLDFKLPSADSKISHLDTDNEIWLRNYKTGALVNKFLIGRRRDRRQ